MSHYCDSISVETLKNLLEVLNGKIPVQVNIISANNDKICQIRNVRSYEDVVVLEVIYD